MNQRNLGNSELRVSPLCFGGNVFGWTVTDESACFRLLDAFTDAGFNFVDTADIYSRWVPGNQGGESERLIGKWFAQGSGRRGRVVLATKCGGEMESGKGLSKRHIMSAAEDSLKRLQTDRIDLYQSHFDDPGTPVEETLEAFDALVQQGKVRAIGASNFSRARLGESLAVAERANLPRYVSLQPQYNLLERAQFEGELQEFCVQEGIGVIPYFALASGFLTGKYRRAADLEGKARGERVRKYLNPHGLAVVEAVEEVAAGMGGTPAQVALAWLLSRPAITAPIVSATGEEQLGEILNAASLQLAPEHIAALDRASATSVGSGKS